MAILPWWVCTSSALKLAVIGFPRFCAMLEPSNANETQTAIKDLVMNASTSSVIADRTRTKNPNGNPNGFVGAPRASWRGQPRMARVETGAGHGFGLDAVCGVETRASRMSRTSTDWDSCQLDLGLSDRFGFSGSGLTRRNPYPTRRSSFSSLGMLSLES